MNLVFHISKDGSEIELKHCASSKTSVKSSQKYFVHLNWISQFQLGTYTAGFSGSAQSMQSLHYFMYFKLNFM